MRKMTEKRNLGQKLADNVAAYMGSWKFIIIQTIIVGVWMALNVIGVCFHWDPDPFILLNLLFSTQAAYAAPIIMMAQNRQGERDREKAAEDYEVNLASKREIEQLMIKLDNIEAKKLDKIIQIIERLEKIPDIE